MIITGLVLAATFAAPPHTAVLPADTACIVMADLKERKSPLDSVTIAAAQGAIKICYGRPSARGRRMLGGVRVPFGKLWRTGANEPTMIHTTAPVELAGIRLQPGSYSLYTVPNEGEWLVVLNRSISQWGSEPYYTGKVKEQEIARAAVRRRRSKEYVETFTITGTTRGKDLYLVMKWENIVVEIPVRWTAT